MNIFSLLAHRAVYDLTTILQKTKKTTPKTVDVLIEFPENECWGGVLGLKLLIAVLIGFSCGCVLLIT